MNVGANGNGCGWMEGEISSEPAELPYHAVLCALVLQPVPFGNRYNHLGTYDNVRLSVTKRDNNTVFKKQ